MKEIDNLITQRRYKEAIRRCSEMIESKDDSEESSKIDINWYRKRAHAYECHDELDNALQDYKIILAHPEYEMKDEFRAATIAIEARKYRFASNRLYEVLASSIKQDDYWFFAASKFLLAYALANLGDFSASKVLLNEAEQFEPTVGWPLPNFGFVDVQKMRDIIRKLEVSS